MADRLTRIEEWATGLLGQLSSGQRASLAKNLAAELRRRQQRRIAAARNPSGMPYAPRKPQLRHKKGRIRRAMFAKLRTAKCLKTTSSADSAVLHFTKQVERIARVHQEGLRDRVRRNGPIVIYPARELLGLADDDVDLISDLILDHLSSTDNQGNRP
jgi:phage virion morphogenesis protein